MKDKTDDNPDSRRKFLNKGLYATAGWLTGMEELLSKEDGKKIKMLTPDGKLVEIDQSLVRDNPNRTKVKNKEILAWLEKDKSINKNQ